MTRLGIIGGGQLGSMLAVAAKKLKIKTSEDTTAGKLLFGIFEKTVENNLIEYVLNDDPPTIS